MQLMRTISCEHRQAMELVYTTVQRMRAAYAEALVTEALSTGEATRTLRQNVGR
tara:strand:+ start:194 stop:355 length:162 start_codon:yes stop_codon:yes gene_type:complete